MYALIQNNLASMYELKEIYTLDEALKLYAFFKMGQDIQLAKQKELEEKTRR